MPSPHPRGARRHPQVAHQRLVLVVEGPLRVHEVRRRRRVVGLVELRHVAQLEHRVLNTLRERQHRLAAARRRPIWPPEEALEESFRRRFLRALERAQRLRPETRARLLSWRHSGFSVKATQRVASTERGRLAPGALRDARGGGGLRRLPATSRLPSGGVGAGCMPARIQRIGVSRGPGSRLTALVVRRTRARHPDSRNRGGHLGRPYSNRRRNALRRLRGDVPGAPAGDGTLDPRPTTAPPAATLAGSRQSSRLRDRTHTGHRTKGVEERSRVPPASQSRELLLPIQSDPRRPPARTKRVRTPSRGAHRVRRSQSHDRARETPVRHHRCLKPARRVPDQPNGDSCANASLRLAEPLAQPFQQVHILVENGED